MALIISQSGSTRVPQYHRAFGLQRTFDVALALLYRGDELIHISPNQNEFPVTVANIKEAKANRDRYIRDGIRYERLPSLEG
jgi:hypothetical protein